MEGNDCYKFSAVSKFIQKTGAKPITLAVDVGSNVGEITQMMSGYFPDARIYAYEAVREYYEITKENCKHNKMVKVFNYAVTSQHLWVGDLNERRANSKLKIMKALPHGGPGWRGGSWVVRESDSYQPNPSHYKKLDEEVNVITLEELTNFVLQETQVSEIDLIKFDCEGCESYSIGTCPSSILKKIRFIVGEYHGIDRFYNIMKNRLYETHMVNLVGHGNIGCFFAERITDGQTMLQKNKDGMLMIRPWLSANALDWHIFHPDFIDHPHANYGW